MVYMDPAELGWQAVFKSWLQQTVPGEITPEQKENIKVSEVSSLVNHS